MSILTTTLREGTQGVRVLVVHGQGDELANLCHVLRCSFVVSEATTPGAAVDRVGELPYACIVCVANGAYRMKEFLEEVARRPPRCTARGLRSDEPVRIRRGDSSRSETSEWVRVQGLPDHIASIPRIIGALTRAQSLRP